MATGLGDSKMRRARLMAAIRFRPAATACQSCLDHLDGYLAAQLTGQPDYPARFPAVAAHLDACPDCAGAYARLYELAMAEAAGQLPNPACWPAPDLSFLQASKPALAESIQAAITRLGDRLRFQLSAVLLPLLAPAPLPSLRGPQQRYGEKLFELTAEAAQPAALPLTLAAYRDGRRPENCLLEITVQLPGRAWPDLAGIPVSLSWPGQHRHAITDPWGLASFEEIPVDSLDQLAVEFTSPG